MRKIIFSDVHGNHFAFDSFLKDLHKNGFDNLDKIFLGDFVGYYYGANEIISYCRTNQIDCILGNHDFNFLNAIHNKTDLLRLDQKYGHSYSKLANEISTKNINFLKSLPKIRNFSINDKSIYLCHGSPNEPLLDRVYPDTNLLKYADVCKNIDIVFCGHTHYKMDRLCNNVRFVNPGSLGQQRDGTGCSYICFDFETEQCDFYTVDFNRKDLVKEIDFFDPDKNNLKEVLFRTK